MRIHNAETFGAALRKRRKELGYTQAKVAAFSGCSAVFLSALENGKETVELGRALRVLNVLGLDLELARRGGLAVKLDIFVERDGGSPFWLAKLGDRGVQGAGAVAERLAPSIRKRAARVA